MAYENVKQVVAEYGIAKKQFEEKMKDAFKNIFETFFRDYPEIQAVGWNQYTPYFNDGDPCEFGVHDKYAVDTDANLDDVSSGYDLEELPFKYLAKPGEFAYEAAAKFKADPKSCHPYYSSYVKNIEAYEEACKNPRYKAVTEGIAELMEVLDSIPEEIYLSAFDDHSFVLATRSGITVNEYNHD